MNKAIFIKNALSIVVGVICLVSTGYGQDASPVRCRDALRPVLLQLSPDRALLPDILHLCEGQARAGDPEALYGSSLLYLGLVDWQPDKAIPMMLGAADSGIPEAQYWLAWQYESGPLLANDAELALYWYLQAGQREHRLALSRLANIFANGELGVPINEKKAGAFRARAARCQS